MIIEYTGYDDCRTVIFVDENNKLWRFHTQTDGLLWFISLHLSNIVNPLHLEFENAAACDDALDLLVEWSLRPAGIEKIVLNYREIK